jgi:hypothetical protein
MQSVVNYTMRMQHQCIFVGLYTARHILLHVTNKKYDKNETLEQLFAMMPCIFSTVL